MYELFLHFWNEALFCACYKFIVICWLLKMKEFEWFPGTSYSYSTEYIELQQAMLI